MGGASSPRWPFTPAAVARREALEQTDVQAIIEERRKSTAAQWAKSTWREVLATEISSPHRVSPRFRCKTPSWGGPLFADRPMHVPLPAGVQHLNFQQTKYRGDVMAGAAGPAYPRRLPTEIPSPRQAGLSPTWKCTIYDHTFQWRS